jgi:hypothetical protein
MFQAMYLSQHVRRIYKTGKGTVPLLVYRQSNTTESRTAEERFRHLWPLQFLMRLMTMVINIITIKLPEMTRDEGRYLTLI